jgi:hypothetical protein
MARRSHTLRHRPKVSDRRRAQAAAILFRWSKNILERSRVAVRLHGL